MRRFLLATTAALVLAVASSTATAASASRLGVDPATCALACTKATQACAALCKPSDIACFNACQAASQPCFKACSPASCETQCTATYSSCVTACPAGDAACPAQCATTYQQTCLPKCVQAKLVLADTSDSDPEPPCAACTYVYEACINGPRVAEDCAAQEEACLTATGCDSNVKPAPDVAAVSVASSSVGESWCEQQCNNAPNAAQCMARCRRIAVGISSSASESAESKSELAIVYNCAWARAEMMQCGKEYDAHRSSPNANDEYQACIRVPVATIQNDPKCTFPSLTSNSKVTRSASSSPVGSSGSACWSACGASADQCQRACPSGQIGCRVDCDEAYDTCMKFCPSSTVASSSESSSSAVTLFPCAAGTPCAQCQSACLNFASDVDGCLKECPTKVSLTGVRECVKECAKKGKDASNACKHEKFAKRAQCYAQVPNTVKACEAGCNRKPHGVTAAVTTPIRDHPITPSECIWNCGVALNTCLKNVEDWCAPTVWGASCRGNGQLQCKMDNNGCQSACQLAPFVGVTSVPDEVETDNRRPLLGDCQPCDAIYDQCLPACNGMSNCQLACMQNHFNCRMNTPGC